MEDLTYILGLWFVDMGVRLLLYLDSIYKNQFHLTIHNRR